MNQRAAYCKKFSPTIVIVAILSFLWKSWYRFISSAFVLIVLALFLICCIFASSLVYSALFVRALDGTDFFGIYFVNIYSIFCLFVIPTFFCRFVYRKKLKDVGLTVPQHKMKALLLTILALMILIYAVIFLVKNKQLHDFYSHTIGGAGWSKIILIQLTILPLYYFGEEFFFRGFLLLILKEKIGQHSYWITDCLFVFAHLFKPIIEMIFAFPAGMILAILTISTRSIYPAIIVHYVVGCALIWAIKFS